MYIMYPFDSASEFVDLDNRRFRSYYPISKTHLHNKHEILFPKELIEGKSVADLGSCMGATGHWCLSMGASRYVGVEVQKEYADLSKQLLGKYHSSKFSIEQKSIEEWLNNNTDTFDIVCMLSVLWAFTDYYSILKKMCAITDTVIIEGPYPDRDQFPLDFCGVHFMEDHLMTLAGGQQSLTGRAARISPKGLEFLMQDFGFVSAEGILHPHPNTESKDMHNDTENARAYLYMMRFTRTEDKKENISEDLQGQRRGRIVPWRSHL